MDNKKIRKQISNASYVSNKRGKYITMINSYRFRVNKGLLQNIPIEFLITKDKTEEQLKNQIIGIQEIINRQRLIKKL
jgi:hypothetical protein